MSTEHGDIGRESGAVLRTMLQVALQVSEQLARRREQRLREATAASERQRHALEGRLRAEQQSAETALRAVHRERWWASATPEQISEQVRLAHTWKDRSPIAADTADVIDEQLRARYGIARDRENLDMAVVSMAVQRDIERHRARAAAGEQYTKDGFTVLEEEPRGPGFVDAQYLRTGEGFDQPITDELVRRDPAKWAVHLVDGPDGVPVPEYYCTDVAALPDVDHERPQLARVWEDKYLDSAPPERLADLHHITATPATDIAAGRAAGQIRERFGVDVDALGSDARASLAAMLTDIDAARRAPGAAEKASAAVGRETAITALMDPAAEMDRSQVAAAWQWYSHTHPREAEHRLYGGVPAAETTGAPFEAYLDHVATEWATEHHPELVHENPSDDQRDELFKAWTEQTASGYPRLADDATRSVLGPPPPVTSTDIETVAEWARHRIPRDYERFTQGTGKTKETGELHLRLRFDIHHAQEWANDHAPALAAKYVQAEQSTDRPAYLSAREELIDSWNAVGRPFDAQLADEPTRPDAPTLERSGAAVSAAAEPGAPAYDSAERREKEASDLLAAGVDEEAVNAHRLADISNAKPATAIDFDPGSGSPRASKGDRSKGKDVSQDRSSR